MHGKCRKVIPKYRAFFRNKFIFGSVPGQFKPVSEIIKNDLTDRQKEELMENIMASVRDIQVTDVAILLSMIMSTSSIQQTVLNAVVAYIGNEMKLQLVD